MRTLSRLKDLHRLRLGGGKQVTGACAEERRKLRRNGRVVRRHRRLTVNRGWRAQMRMVRRRARVVVVVAVMPVAVVTDVGGGEVVKRRFAQRRPAAVVVVADLLQRATAGRCCRGRRRQHVEMGPLWRRFTS